jgi:hypothetical protein
MTHEERARKAVADCELAPFPVWHGVIHKALVEASNDELERRRAVEKERDRLRVRCAALEMLLMDVERHV